MAKLRIAVFAGPTATMLSSPNLVTSDKAREKYGLAPRTDPDGGRPRFDVLRPQRLAAPVTVYIEQFSGHPLEQDRAELYAPPDGYVDAGGAFHEERVSDDDVPVYEVTLRPEDGLFPLPYMARQAGGKPWDDDVAYPRAPAEKARIVFFPDGSRLFEEIDRLAVSDQSGVNGLLSSKADFDFYRALPSGGYSKGLAAKDRTDAGDGDIPPEKLGEDFYPFRPFHLRRDPSMADLARLTNCVRRALESGRYDGAIWLEGTPTTEETAYWLNLVIDTGVPIACNASQRSHGSVSNDGDRNVIDSVDYIASRIWADESGRDAVGVVMIQDEQIFTARDVQKADARPGGYIATGGHGGIVGALGRGKPVLSFMPIKRHTHSSETNLSRIPAVVQASRRADGKLVPAPVQVKDDSGDLLPTAIPRVGFEKYARYLPTSPSDGADAEVGVLARIERNLEEGRLAGFIGEGSAPYGRLSASVGAALRLAVLSGMPVVNVGRGNAEGMTGPNPGYLTLGGGNLTATKARILLMACLLRFGGTPPAADPHNPTDAEVAAVRAKLVEYQAVFDSH